MKSLRVTTFVKKINFDGVWDELQAKNCFQRIQVKKYLRLTLVFMRNSALRKKFFSVFQDFFAGINKNFILTVKDWAIGNYSLKF